MPTCSATGWGSRTWWTGPRGRRPSWRRPSCGPVRLPWPTSSRGTGRGSSRCWGSPRGVSASIAPVRRWGCNPSGSAACPRGCCRIRAVSTRTSSCPTSRPSTAGCGGAQRRGGSGVVVHRDGVGQGKGLAGEHVAGVDLGRLEGVVAPHLHLAGRDPRPAGAADPALAGEGEVAADLLRRIQDGYVAGEGDRRRPPVEDDGDLTARAGHDLVVPTYRLRRDVVDVEQLLVHAVGRYAELREQGTGLTDHPVRAAQPPVVDALGVHQVGDEGAEAVAVEPAAGDLGVAGLAGQYVHELESGAVTVLEVGQLVGEHHRVRPPVAVEDGDGGPPVTEHRGGQRQRGGDAGAGHDEDVVARYGQVGREGARRRQYLDGVPGPDLVDQVRREEPARHPAHAHPRRGTHGGADRVGAALVPLAVDPAEGERLARPEPVVVGEFLRDVERDGDRVVGEPVDAGHRQRVELRPATDARSLYHHSDLLHVLEGLATGPAAAQRLAGRGAEFAQVLGGRGGAQGG